MPTNVFEDHIHALRTNPTDGEEEKAFKVADDLEAMDKVMVAITGEGDESPPTITWHNTALELLMDVVQRMEIEATAEVLSFMTSGDLQAAGHAMGEVKRRSLVLMFMMGHELGEGEYNIEKHDMNTCQENAR